jgi:hypothetical protein
LRYAWLAGVVYVVALVAQSAVGAAGIKLNQNDSATRIASRLHAHRGLLLIIAYLSVVVAVSFLIYLWGLYRVLHEDSVRRETFSSLLLVGGVLFITPHSVSDIGITGLVGAKLATYGFLHDPGLSYTLYLMTYAIDSVGDVFGSIALLAIGLLTFRSGVLPRWLGWLAIVAGCMLLLQGFGLGGVIATFGLILDLIGFVLFLILVLASSILLMRRRKNGAVPT